LSPPIGPQMSGLRVMGQADPVAAAPADPMIARAGAA
jgi:hypothetical protein